MKVSPAIFNGEWLLREHWPGVIIALSKYTGFIKPFVIAMMAVIESALAEIPIDTPTSNLWQCESGPVILYTI